MKMTPKKSVLRDTQFPHRRTILGVLDFTCPAFFYWQAFNEAKRYLLSLQ